MNTVTLALPADADYVRLARLASADAGSRAGLDYEEIEDLRIGVTELCHVLIGDGGDGRMELEFQTGADEVTIIGHSDLPGTPELNEFAELILAQVVDTHVVRADGSARVFELTKRRRASTPS